MYKNNNIKMKYNSCSKNLDYNDPSNIKVSFNLCGNDQVLSWAYHLENDCENKFEFFYYSNKQPDTLGGVENLKGQNLLELASYETFYNNLDPNSCDNCICDSTLIFPQTNLNSKLTILLLTQEYKDYYWNNPYPGFQYYNPEFVIKVPPGISYCNFEYSTKSTYRIWKAIINAPIQCYQKVEFTLISEIEAHELFDDENYWYENFYIKSDIARIETILTKFF